MDNTSKGIAWVGNIFRKFEAMCREVDNMILQERLKYVENQLQTVGANVKQFCSDVVHDVLPKPHVDTVQDAAYDSSSVQNTDKASEMSMEGTHEDHFEKEPCNLSHLLHSCPLEPIKVMQCDLSLEEADGAGIYEKSEVCAMENHSKEKQPQLEMTDEITLEEKDPSKSLSSPSSNSLTKIILTDVSSLKSVNLVDSCEGELLDVQLTPGDSSAESVRKLDDSTDSPTNLGSSCKVELDNSCIIIDSSELSPVSSEARIHRSYKKNFKEALTTKKRAAKQDHDHHAAWHGNPDLGSSQQKGEGFSSSSITTLDHEFCESDWEII